jgi:hypothetical protein
VPVSLSERLHADKIVDEDEEVDNKILRVWRRGPEMRHADDDFFVMEHEKLDEGTGDFVRI